MQKKSSLKPFYLSLSKWRCGGEKSENVLGKGKTRLRNNLGFECCLGQGLSQFDPSTKITRHDEPCYTKTKHTLFVTVETDQYDDDEPEVYVYNSEFSWDAMQINDDKELTTPERIVALEFLLQGEGYRLVVVD